MSRRAVSILLRTGCAAAALASGAVVFAQEAMHEWPRSAESMAQRVDDARRWGTTANRFSIVDLAPAGANQRPRHALRMRFDSATRAMRSFGIEAEECSSLVRSHTRMAASEPGSSERLTVSVSVALNCRFF